MIVVDLSVWIAHLRDSDTPEVRKLRAFDDPDQILVGDLILLEVLQGARDERAASLVRLHGSELKLEDNEPGLRARIALNQDTMQITRAVRVSSEQEEKFHHEPVYP